MAKHPNKHIREAIRYAEGKGWTVTKGGARAHIWGTLWCPESSREGCRIFVMSTPRDPERHPATFDVMWIDALIAKESHERSRIYPGVGQGSQ